MKLKLLILASAVSWTACATDVSSEERARAEAQPYDDEVAVNVAELSSITTIGEVCEGICGYLAIADDFALVIQTPNDQSLALALLSDPEVVSVPTAFRMGGVVASADQLFYLVDLTNNAIKRFSIFGNTTITTTTSNVTGLASNGTWLYWTDGNGLRRTDANGGGLQQRLLSHTMASSLQLLDGNKAYFTRMIGAGTEYELRKFDANTWTNTLLRTSTTGMWGFSQDATNIYWIDGGPTYRLRRLNKSTLTLTTLRSTTKVMGVTAAHAGVVYWAEVPSAGGNMELMKRATDGVITTERSGRIWIGGLQITPTHLHWLEKKTAADPMLLKRAAL